MNQSVDRDFRLTRARTNAKKLRTHFQVRRNEILDKKSKKSIRKPKQTSCDTKRKQVKAFFATRDTENVIFEVKQVSSSGLKLRFQRVVTEKIVNNEHISNHQVNNPVPKKTLSIREYAKQIQPKVCPLFYPTSDKEANELILQISERESETTSANIHIAENRLSMRSNVLHVTKKSDEQNKMEETLAKLKAEKEAKLMEKVRMYRARLVAVLTPC